MRTSFFLPLFILTMSACAQYNTFEEMATDMASGDVPMIKVNAFSKALQNKENIIILDAREIAEYNISHIKNAIFVGYDNFKKKNLENVPKNAKVVVYCSVGYRSCKIGEKMRKMGYTNVYNLYGGLFDWVNNENPLVDNDENSTKKIHAYNKDWGKWIQKGEKIY